MCWRSLAALAAAVVCNLAAGAVAMAQQHPGGAGVLVGRVLDEGGQPVTDAVVRVEDVRRQARVDTDEPLPRIPPFRYGLALHYRGDRPWALVALRRVAEQQRTGRFEIPTDGYTFLSASAGYRFFAGR